MKVKEFRQKFTKRHNSSICRDLVGYDFSDDEQKKVALLNGRFQEVCPIFVQDAIEILEQMLIE